MTTQNKHTPTPWKVLRFTDIDKRIEIASTDGAICWVDNDDTEDGPANAEFITLACNSHYDLIWACMLGCDASAALLIAIKEAKTLDDVMTHPGLDKYNGFGVHMNKIIARATGREGA